LLVHDVLDLCLVLGEERGSTERERGDKPKARAGVRRHNNRLSYSGVKMIIGPMSKKKWGDSITPHFWALLIIFFCLFIYGV